MKKKNTLDRKIRFVGLAFLFPAICMILFAVVIPFLWNVVLSFHQWNGNGKMEFVRLDNFKKVFQDASTVKTIKHSLVISITATAIAMLLGTTLALMIYKMGRRMGTFFRFVFYSPSMLPMTVVGFLFTFILATGDGLLNNILKAAGFGNLQQAWLAKPGLVLFSIAAVQGWRFSGTIMMLTYTGIAGLPLDLFESAKLDGATYWKEVRYIILPLVKPTIQMALSMMVMWAFKTYDIVFAMTGGGPGDISKTAPIRMIEVAFTFNQYGYASAIGLVLAVCIIICILIMRRLAGGEAYEY